MLCYVFGNSLDYDHNYFRCQIWIFSISVALDKSLQFNCETRRIVVLDPYARYQIFVGQCYLCIVLASATTYLLTRATSIEIALC